LGGDSLWQFQITLYCTLVTLPPPSRPLYPLPTSLRAIASVSLFYFVYVYEVHQLYSLTFISSIHPPTHSTKYAHTQTLYLFYSPVSLLIPESMLTGVSWSIPAVSIFYLVSSTPSI
jgi:hypothetical protein